VFDQLIYLAAIKDLWNAEIIAYHISNRNDNPLVLETFSKAVEAHQDINGAIPGSIVHSVQDSQNNLVLPQYAGDQISMSHEAIVMTTLNR
jgi:putative transposase